MPDKLLTEVISKQVSLAVQHLTDKDEDMGVRPSNAKPLIPAQPDRDIDHGAARFVASLSKNGKTPGGGQGHSKQQMGSGGHPVVNGQSGGKGARTGDAATGMQRKTWKVWAGNYGGPTGKGKGKGAKASAKGKGDKAKGKGKGKGAQKGKDKGKGKSKSKTKKGQWLGGKGK
jgi:hypothetical protein